MALGSMSLQHHLNKERAVTKLEKKMILAVVVLLLAATMSLANCSHEMERRCGFKQLIISVGKEVKDISEQIAEE